MEDLMIALQQRIKDALPELSYIDEDYGQLQTNEDTYPVTFPCVLIGNVSVDWNDVGVGVQKGLATINVRLCMDCYDDTYYGSGTEDKMKGRLEKNRTLYKSLQGFHCSKYMSALNRLKSTDYSLPGGIKVYETIYAFKVHDNSAAIR